jgi:hypothetical protein
MPFSALLNEPGSGDQGRGTALETDNGRSVLAAGTGLHAPNASFEATRLKRRIGWKTAIQRDKKAGRAAPVPGLPQSESIPCPIADAALTSMKGCRDRRVRLCCAPPDRQRLGAFVAKGQQPGLDHSAGTVSAAHLFSPLARRCRAACPICRARRLPCASR